MTGARASVLPIAFAVMGDAGAAHAVGAASGRAIKAAAAIIRVLLIACSILHVFLVSGATCRGRARASAARVSVRETPYMAHRVPFIWKQVRAGR